MTYILILSNSIDPSLLRLIKIGLNILCIKICKYILKKISIQLSLHDSVKQTNNGTLITSINYSNLLHV